MLISESVRRSAERQSSKNTYTLSCAQQLLPPAESVATKPNEMDSSPDLSLKLRRGSSDSRDSFYMDFAQGIDSDIEEVENIATGANAQLRGGQNQQPQQLPQRPQSLGQPMVQHGDPSSSSGRDSPPKSLPTLPRLPTLPSDTG